MKISIIAFFLILFYATNAQPFEPINKNATAEVKKLLSYLYTIDGKYILAGQHNYHEEQTGSLTVHTLLRVNTRQFGEPILYGTVQEVTDRRL